MVTRLRLAHGRELDLSAPCVMGVLNVTPDSFSDGGRYQVLDAALRQAERLVQAGAAVIDVGGESTRPGADPVGQAEELERVAPVIEALAQRVDCLISIDTTKPAVMREACRLGAHWINDIQALQAPGAVEVAAETGAAVCLMHMQGAPRTMQQSPHYDDVLGDVEAFFQARVRAAEVAGIARACLVLDPGIGFGKRPEDNWALLAQLDRFRALGFPLLVGVSRKSLFGQLLGLPPEGRLVPSLAAAAVSVFLGAAVVRAHDVEETRQVLAVAAALRDARAGGRDV